jgi:hypothetical protein
MSYLEQELTPWEVEQELKRSFELELALKLIYLNWYCDVRSNIWTSPKYPGELFDLKSAAERAGILCS